MAEFSKNPRLNREQSFHGKVVLLVHFLFFVLAMLLFVNARASYEESGGWSVGCLLRYVLAAAEFGYYWYSASQATGVFYPLDLWEQSLLQRRSYDELERAYYRGERIFVDYQEAEAFDGRFVPKPGGMKLQRPGEGHDMVQQDAANQDSGGTSAEEGTDS